MKLITELTENVEYLSEAKESGEKDHYIHGIFLQGNMKNRNGRIYPIHILDKEVNRYVNEVVKPSRAFGELGHPSGPQINLDRVSHIITELKHNLDNSDILLSNNNLPCFINDILREFLLLLKIKKI